MDGIHFSGNWIELISVGFGGIIGALAKDAIQDGCFQLPYIKDNKLILGFLGGAIVGAFVGIVVDGSFITAMLGGYVGISVISNLLPSQSRTKENKKQTEISSSLK
jgi:hypothetical protein